MSIMRQLDHRHIVKYLGVGGFLDGGTAVGGSGGGGNSGMLSMPPSAPAMFLVLELMRGRNLKRLVQQQMTSPYASLYSHEDALRWCIQIAGALAYLHERSPAVRRVGEPSCIFASLVMSPGLIYLVHSLSSSGAR